jgi:hypothetical protein
MNDKDTKWRVSMQWTIGNPGRHWGISAEWLGRWRLLTVGVALNFAAPGATLWLAGWRVLLGRIPRTPKTFSVEIPDRATPTPPDTPAGK